MEKKFSDRKKTFLIMKTIILNHANFMQKTCVTRAWGFVYWLMKEMVKRCLTKGYPNLHNDGT